MTAERFNCIVPVVCIKKRNSCAIDVKLLAAVLFNFAPLSDLDKCQLSEVVINLAINWLLDSSRRHQYTLLRHI